MFVAMLAIGIALPNHEEDRVSLLLFCGGLGLVPYGIGWAIRYILIGRNLSARQSRQV
jgi:hypothetical protein